MSDSKQWLYSNLRMDHRTLDNCILNGSLYLNRIYFSLEVVVEFLSDAKATKKSEQELISLVESCKYQVIKNQPARKYILAQNVLHPELTRTYPSIRELSKDLTVDRSTVRKHLKGDYNKLYKNQWKFSLTDFNS